MWKPWFWDFVSGGCVTLSNKYGITVQNRLALCSEQQRYWFEGPPMIPLVGLKKESRPSHSTNLWLLVEIQSSSLYILVKYTSHHVALFLITVRSTFSNKYVFVAVYKQVRSALFQICSYVFFILTYLCDDLCSLKKYIKWNKIKWIKKVIFL